MATITFSGLVSQITGKHGGDIMRKGKSKVTLMAGYQPSGSVSSRQFVQRGSVNNYSGQWYSLSDTLKEMWNKYASLLPSPMAGFDAYVKLNVRLASADHVDLVPLTAPPTTPSTPSFLEGFVVTA